MIVDKGPQVKIPFVISKPDSLRVNEGGFQVDLGNSSRAKEIRKNGEHDQHNNHEHTDDRHRAAPKASPDKLSVTFVHLFLDNNRISRLSFYLPSQGRRQNDVCAFGSHAEQSSGLTIT